MKAAFISICNVELCSGLFSSLFAPAVIPVCVHSQYYRLNPLGSIPFKYKQTSSDPPCVQCVSFSSSVIHVPGVNDIQSSAGSAGQNLAQISRQINSSQVQWSGSRPPFSGQVKDTLHNTLFYFNIPCLPHFCSLMYFPITLPTRFHRHHSFPHIHSS